MVEQIKDLLLLVVTIGTYASYVPQIVKLYKTKSSDDLSVLSWILWVSSSKAYFIYAVLTGGFWLVFASLSELILMIIVLVLTIKYRKT